MGIITPPTLMLHSAQFRIALRDLLEEFGYPPEECERAVRTVLEQAKLNAKNID